MMTVVYTLATPGGCGVDFDGVRDAAQAFLEADATLMPRVIQTTIEGGRERARVVGSTSVIDFRGEKQYGKYAASGSIFGRVYADLLASAKLAKQHRMRCV